MNIKNLNKKTLFTWQSVINGLTVSRIFFGLPIIISLNYGKNDIFIILILIGCLTDFFDGYFARRFNVTSNFGKIIDPVADKMLVIGTLFALSSENFFNYHYTFIPAFIIILREIFITGLREQVSKDKITLNVSMLAKWKTTIQLIACSSYLIWRSDNFFFQSILIEYACIFLLWIAAFITIITCYDYLKKVWRHL